MPSSYQHVLCEKPSYVTLQNVIPLENVEYFNSLCGVNAMIPETNMICNEVNIESRCPYLNVIEQPAETIRFRYKSEKGSHGGIKGEGATRGKKSYPTVKLENCPSDWREKVVIKVSLYTNESVPKPHVYELTGKNCSNGKCEAKLDENFTAILKSLAISAKKKEEVLEFLKQLKISDNDFYDEASVEAEILEEMKNMNLDSVKLCFEAFFTDNNTLLCDKVFSKSINNQKSTATGDLKITRLSRCSGKCSGGDEVFLLCEKIKKEDIKVRFFEKPDEGNWEAYAEFNPAEIHHQVVIVFKTPEYHRNDVKKQVYIELVRPSDKKCSESRKFDYIPDDDGIFRLSDRQLKDTGIGNFVKKEFSESSRKRKRLSIDTDETMNIIDNSIMDSPESIDEENIIPKELDDFLNDEFNFTFFEKILEDPGNTRMENQSMSFESLNDFQPLTFVSADSVNQISSSMKSLSVTDEELETLEMQESSKDFIDGVKKILEKREASTYLHYARHLIPLADENGNNMLHLAVMEQNENCSFIKKLLEMVSKDLINKQNNFKETPLHLAIKRNQPKILLALLAKGGDPNILEKDGNNCLHLAAKYGLINCLKVLTTNKKSWAGKTVIDTNAVNYDGMSALHIAIVNHFEDCTKILLNCEADVNLQEKKGGQTSLHLAIEQPSLFQAILNHPESDVGVKDFRGCTAIQLLRMKIKESFEVHSTWMKDDKDQLIKVLEKLYKNEGICDSESSEAESDTESTCSSDFEDAVEDVGSISCQEVICKTISIEKKSSLMKTEEELCKFLDVNDNWKKIADMIGLDSKHVAMLDKGLSPASTLLRKIKVLYHPEELQAIIELLKLTGLEEGVLILQRNS